MKKLIVFMFSIVLLGSCQKDIEGCTDATAVNYNPDATIDNSSCQYVPTLSTIPVVYNSGSTAESGGVITSNGGNEISLKGVCWSILQNPTTENDTSINGNGIGNFNSVITNLNFNTTYYVRSYATNSNGTGYGDELSFNTNFQPCNITSTTNNVNGWYFLLDQTTTVYNTGDTFNIEMSSPSNYNFSTQNTCKLYLNELFVQNIGNQFSSYYDGNGLLIYGQDFIIPSGLSPSNCYNVRVTKAQDSWISSSFTILP